MLFRSGAGVDGERLTAIAGAAAPTADLAAAVCGAAVEAVLAGRVPVGAHSTADLAVDPLALLHRATALGVRVQEFTGVARATSW